jgi:hypothetical protein
MPLTCIVINRHHNKWAKCAIFCVVTRVASHWADCLPLGTPFFSRIVSWFFRLDVVETSDVGFIAYRDVQ